MTYFATIFKDTREPDTLEFKFVQAYAIYGTPVVDVDVIAVNGKTLDDPVTITISMEYIFNGYPFEEAIEQELLREDYGDYHLPNLHTIDD